ncbi:MAG: hypothetical protein DCO97_21545 [Marivita sp. XM-24bin2]|jgi:glutathione S-transferase|nr:MAG: hypothetical protein DCO97_21545 [Marivita sp. XM-24bin2]
MARLALAEKRVAHEFVEVASWDGYRKDPAFADLHPFAKVPVLDHGPVRLFETLAICSYIDEAFEGPGLQPTEPLERARMLQLISATLDYAWPIWEPMFATERFFAAFEDRLPDEDRIASAMPRLTRAAEMVDALLAARPAGAFDLSDIFLAGSFCYLAEAPEGAAVLGSNPALARWWQGMQQRASVIGILPPTDWPQRLGTK